MDIVYKKGAIMTAQDIIREQKTTDPHSNPKHFGYVESHKLAVDDPNIRGEYDMRMSHLGKVARGEIAGGQGMFDFYGHRDSNEGVLSNEAPTAEDSWMKAVSFNMEGDVKRGGDALVKKKIVKSRDEAFTDLLNNDSPFYVTHLSPTPEDAIRAIRKAGGVAVIAHPFASRRGQIIDESTFQSLVTAGLNGIEVYHRDHSEEERNQLIAVARSVTTVCSMPIGQRSWSVCGLT
jgi:hypothetical protein